MINQSNINILICADKFKGSLTALDVNNSIIKGLPKQCSKIVIALADGGQGSLQIISQYIDGQWIQVRVLDPLFRQISSKYYLKGNIAYIEMAKASGLTLLSLQQRNPCLTSTFGTGQLIKHALSQGAKQINMFIGGSATNDGGIGMANALGFQFYNENKEKLKAIGQNLIKIKHIEFPKNINDGRQSAIFKIFSDVKNPLLGQNGAARIYGPQKGAKKAEIFQLEQGLTNLNNLFINIFNKQISQIPGSGAAGGLGAGLMVFLQATIHSGIQRILNVVQLQQKLKSADLVITGQGKLDEQTLQGKVVSEIIQLSQKHHKQLWIVCGICEIPNQWQNSVKIIELVDKQVSYEKSMNEASNIISQKIKAIFMKQYKLQY